MIKPIILGAWLLGVAVSSFGMGQCSAPQISVKFNITDPPVLRSKTIADLSNFHSESPNAMRSSHTLGMYNAEITVSIDSEASVRSRFFTQTQLCPTKVDVNLRVDHKIYIASEIGAGSCPYNSTLAHERRHEAAHIKAVQAMREEVRSLILANLYQLFGKDKETVSTQFDSLQENLSKILAHSITTSTAGVHEKIDTEKEYDRVSKSCGGEFQSLLKNQN